jgi:hypothetical protein
MIRTNVTDVFQMLGLRRIAALDPFHLLGAVLFDAMDLKRFNGEILSIKSSARQLLTCWL